MKQATRKKLEAAGWRVGTVREFLGLSRREAALIEIRLALATALRARRLRLHLTQAELARRLGSSQSRIAKLEAGGPGVTLDLMILALLGLGATPREIGRCLTDHAA